MTWLARFARYGPAWQAASVFLLTLVFYLAKPLITGDPDLASGDNIPTRLVPVSLLREGNFDLDEFPQLRQDGKLPYFLQPAHGHFWSKYPVGGPLLITPIYAVLQRIGCDVLDNDRLRDLSVCGIAAVLSALSVLLVYLTYAPRGPARALAVAAIYGFGTGVWPMCAQDLWQHTFGVLFMSLCLYALERGHDDDRWLGWLGLPAGLLFFVRPGNGLLVAVLAVAVFLRKRIRIIPFVCLVAPFAAWTLWYNLTHLGYLFGGYTGEANNLKPWQWLSTGLPGLLVSPSHGLLVYSPILLLAACFWEDSARPRRWLLVSLAGLFLVQLLTYGSYSCWYGGYCFGPRFLLEVMPLCAGLLWYAWPRITASRLGRALTMTTALWAVVANGTGYCFSWGMWSSHPSVDRCPGRLWDWRDNPLVSAVLGLPPVCPHPLTATQPFLLIDGVQVDMGRGWSLDESIPALEALGSEAELIVDFHGRPAGLIVLTLLSEPGLPQRQVVTASLNGERKTRQKLPENTPVQLIVPVSRQDLARQQSRMTLHFSECRRRSALDIRLIAARLQAVQIGLHSPASAKGIAATRLTASPADAPYSSAAIRPAP